MGLPLNCSSVYGEFSNIRCRPGKQSSSGRIRRRGHPVFALESVVRLLRYATKRGAARAVMTVAAQGPFGNSHRRFTMHDAARPAARLLAYWHKLVWLIVLGIWLAVPAALPAQTQSNWLGVNGGNWTDPTLWSTNPNFPNNGTPAGATYAATIATSGTYTVSLNAAVAVNSVTLNNATATLALTSGGNLTIVNSA